MWARLLTASDVTRQTGAYLQQLAALATPVIRPTVEENGAETTCSSRRWRVAVAGAGPGAAPAARCAVPPAASSLVVVPRTLASYALGALRALALS